LIGKKAMSMEKTKAAAWATQIVLEQIGGLLK